MNEEKKICHVCKKEKKPYTLFIKNDIFSIIQYQRAREDGEICQRCDQYHAMTGKFKDATKEEFEIAKKSAWFANMVQKWWEKEQELEFDEAKGDIESVNMRSWEGTELIASWCRDALNSKKEGDDKNG